MSKILSVYLRSKYSFCIERDVAKIPSDSLLLHTLKRKNYSAEKRIKNNTIYHRVMKHNQITRECIVS